MARSDNQKLQELGFRVWGFGVRAWGFKFWDTGFVSGLGLKAWRVFWDTMSLESVVASGFRAGIC